MQYCCPVHSGAPCTLSFPSGGPGKCKAPRNTASCTFLKQRQTPLLRYNIKKYKKKLCLSSLKPHTDLFFKYDITVYNTFHSSAISILSQIGKEISSYVNLVRIQDVGQAGAHQCCSPAPQRSFKVIGILSD